MLKTNVSAPVEAFKHRNLTVIENLEHAFNPPFPKRALGEIRHKVQILIRRHRYRWIFGRIILDVDIILSITLTAS